MQRHRTEPGRRWQKPFLPSILGEPLWSRARRRLQGSASHCLPQQGRERGGSAAESISEKRGTPSHIYGHPLIVSKTCTSYGGTSLSVAAGLQFVMKFSLFRTGNMPRGAPDRPECALPATPRGFLGVVVGWMAVWCIQLLWVETRQDVLLWLGMLLGGVLLLLWLWMAERGS